jgi:hypothetical protein
MSPASVNNRAPSRNGRALPAGVEATCPTCDSPISPEKLASIVGKLRSHDAEVERAAEARFALVRPRYARRPQPPQPLL